MWYMNEERKLLQQAFRDFAQTRVRPYVQKMEKEDADAKELLLEMGKLGFFNLFLEEKYGGNLDYISWGLLIEELGKESHTVAFLTTIQGMFARLLIEIGTEEQIKKYLPPYLAGECIFASAANEGGASFEYATTATKDGDGWRLNGSKAFITNADVADIYFVYARTETGVDQFIVPAGAAGLKPGHIENKMGWHGSHTGDLFFDDVYVPDENRIVGGGEKYDLTDGCGYYAAAALGGAETVLEKTVAYLKERMQFGNPIWLAHECTRVRAGELSAKILCFKNAVYGHLANLNNGEKNNAEAAALKPEGNKLLNEVAGECMILMGGTGIVRETGIERFYRDIKQAEIGCGPNPMVYSMVAAQL